MTQVIIEGRPDFGNWDFGVTHAKRFPKYVYSQAKSNGCLIHKIADVELRWWEAHFDYMVRLDTPKVIAHTVCGMAKFITHGLRKGNALTCAVPKPDAVLCGKCHGETCSFPRKDPASKQKRKEAKLKLGCIVGALLLCPGLSGCAAKKPVQFLYCDRVDAGHCVQWATGHGPSYPSCEPAEFGGQRCR
jgi:hypothetical protein